MRNPETRDGFTLAQDTSAKSESVNDLKGLRKAPASV